MWQPEPAAEPPRPRSPFRADRRRDRSPPARPEPRERIGPPPKDRHERPQEDDVVEPDRTSAEADQRLELSDRLGQRRQAEQDGESEEDEAPQPRPRLKDEEEDDGQPLHPARDRPEEPGEDR